LETWIPSSRIDYYASRWLGAGPGVKVDSPPEIIAAMGEKAMSFLNLYQGQLDLETKVGTPG
jgi:hypothetical protein